MAPPQLLGNINPTEFSVDEQGRVMINNPILAAAIHEQLSQQATARPSLGVADGLNQASCGNNC